MSEREPREELASIASAARRLLELERARGGGELLAGGIASARRERATPGPATQAEPSRGEAPARTDAPATAARATAAAAPPAKPGRAPAATRRAAEVEPPAPAPESSPPGKPAATRAADFELTPPEPPSPRRAAVAGEPAAVALELPPFADDLYPAALAGGREGLVAGSLPVLNAVAAESRACTKCGLHATRTQAVPGVGSAASGIVFVGEAPGADEDARGEPFVGRAGELLTRMIEAMDEKKLIPGVPLTRETVYICNVLKCRPPENRNPLPHEIECCSPYVLRQLEALQPRVICCLGKFAAELLLGLKGTIAGMRGRTYRWRGAKLIVTYHPAYCLRSPSAKRPVWDDLQRLAQEYLTD